MFHVIKDWTMTLANMESNKSQRENHLDDLENAFLDEAPLADSVSSVSSPVQLVQKDTIDNDSSTELSEEEDIKLKSSDDLEGPTPFQPLIPHPDKASNYSTNQTHQPLLQKSEDSSQDDFAHSNMDRISNTDSAGGHVTSIHFHEPDVTELRMNDTPLHQPFDTQLNANKRASFAMEDEEYEIHNNDRPLNNDSLFNNEPQESYNQRASRRMIFVGIVLTLAVAGLAVGLISPGQGTRICGDGENATLTNCTIADIIDPEPTPTIPSQPTPAPTFRKYLTFPSTAFVPFQLTILIPSFFLASRPLWTKAKNILIENSVVREEELRGDSLLPPDQTLQEKVLNILVFQDEIFISYLSTYSNEPSLISTIQIIQRYVLTLFGVSMNYGNWKNNQGWVATDQSECDWYGVLCENKPWNRTGQFTVMPTVTSVSLNKNGLRGNFPRELMNLTKLENLELWVNDLSGTIPDEIGLLTSLKRLWIHETKNMSGTIPSTFTELTNLESVFLGVNKLNGTIPSDIGKLKRLKAFAVYYNQLTGTIPSSLTSSTDLTKLFLDENKLTGSIPPSIGSLAKLEDLRLCGNDLTGTLPPSMTAFESLQVLYLDRNKFGGEIMDYIVSGWFKMGKF